MVNTYTIKQYPGILNNRIKSLNKAVRRNPSKAATFLVKKAKQLAPRKTGATIRGIRKRKLKKGYTVESWVPGTFKQNMWANRSDPFRTNRRMGMYGKGQRITGTPAFFTVATHITRKKFFDTMRKDTKKSLRVRI
jgi:hypothetical protein